MAEDIVVIFMFSCSRIQRSVIHGVTLKLIAILQEYH
jgi:hypothetical protein